MSRKERNLPKQMLTVLLLLAAASQLTGCGSLLQEPGVSMDTTTSVTHSMPGEAQAWTRLGDMTDHAEMRSVLNAYVSPEDTLLTAMKKPEFRSVLREKYLYFSRDLSYIDVAACNAYEAVVDAYFHLTDTAGRYFGGDELLSRAQAMALVTRAAEQVPAGSDAQGSRGEFLEQLGQSPYAEQASYQAEHAYVRPGNGLDAAALEEPMTRIEFLYLVVSASGVMPEPDRPTAFSSVNADAASDVTGLEAIRRFAQGSEGCVPEELYEALCTAYSRDEGHRVITTRMDYAAPLTKQDAIAFIAAVACGREPVPTTETTAGTTTTATTRATTTTAAATTASQTTAAAPTTQPVTTSTAAPATVHPVHTTAVTTTAVQPQTKSITNAPFEHMEPATAAPPQTEPPVTEAPATEQPQTDAPAPAETPAPPAEAQ